MSIRKLICHQAFDYIVFRGLTSCEDLATALHIIMAAEKDLSQHIWSGHKWSRGTIYDNINGPAGPLMSSYLVPPDHLCIDINGPGKT